MSVCHRMPEGLSGASCILMTTVAPEVLFGRCKAMSFLVSPWALEGLRLELRPALLFQTTLKKVAYCVPSSSMHQCIFNCTARILNLDFRNFWKFQGASYIVYNIVHVWYGHFRKKGSTDFT